MSIFSKLKLKMISRSFERLPLGCQVVVLAVFSFLFIVVGMLAAYIFSISEMGCGHDVGFASCCRYFHEEKLHKFSGYFGEHLRGHLFAGYISLGAFLLSLKTFIIIGMKKNVYDSDAYKKHHNKLMKKNGSSQQAKDKARYAPLVQLSDFIFFAIVFSLLAAIAQVSVGLIDHYFAALFCLWLVVFATLLLFNCLRLIKRNIDIWLKN